MSRVCDASMAARFSGPQRRSIQAAWLTCLAAFLPGARLSRRRVAASTAPPRPYVNKHHHPLPLTTLCHPPLIRHFSSPPSHLLSLRSQTSESVARLVTTHQISSNISRKSQLQHLKWFGSMFFTSLSVRSRDISHLISMLHSR